ncbi:hypothetical protein ABHD89_001065 [Salinicoccus halitifaciens]|uniref:DUF1541 domain-containing protein n=1 Tax=Salinicoccus halitifaciens TaxID=1073415 RepID=A0ABV2E8B3_9STAP
MKQFQKISLSGAMISALVLGLSTGAANAGGSDTTAHEDGSYYYYEVNEAGDKTKYIDGLTKKELEDKLGFPYNGESSHYYYEVNTSGEKTNYINGLTKAELEKMLHHSDMQSEPHFEGDVSHMEHMEGMEHMEHSAEEMSSSGEVPEDLELAKNPTYEVGSQAIIEGAHMQGMDGAEATISGAFDTTVYTVSYIPTNGGELVEDHKWVIHEELENPGDAPLEPGDEAVMNATHMEGMEGATATIDSSEETTVYMVDFVTTDTEEQVQNHKWVTESELAPVE